MQSTSFYFYAMIIIRTNPYKNEVLEVKIFEKKGIPQYEYKPAAPGNLSQIWNKDIARNFGDPQWIAWKQEYIANNQNGNCKTFIVLCNGIPVGQGTLLFSPVCGAIGGRTNLADGAHTANVNALRIDKAHENKGHISKLIHLMEAYAATAGYKTLTIGVEAQETRTLAIYLHLGYNTFVASGTDEDVLVLYYLKQLSD